MNQYYIYGQKVSKIGTRMSITQNKFGESSQRKLETLNDVRALKKIYYSLNEEFKSQRDDLEKVVAPQIIKELHDEMVKGYRGYVIGTETMISALDTEKVGVKKEVYKRGEAMQADSASKIANAAKKIADIIVK